MNAKLPLLNHIILSVYHPLGVYKVHLMLYETMSFYAIKLKTSQIRKEKREK